MPNILDLARTAKADADAKAKADALAAFKALLAKFAIDHDPQDTVVTVDGVTIHYLNPREISIIRKCQNCDYTLPTDGMSSLQQLAVELDTRPLPDHDCPAKRHN